jgi:LPXTG-motif cell wall-anchored protein
MKAGLVFACAAAGIGLLAGGTAAADDAYGTLEITPGVLKPGDSVTLTATCSDPNFTAPAPVNTGSLVETALTGTKGADNVWRLTATTTVQPDLESGDYSAGFQCGPDHAGVSVHYTVEADGPPYAAIGIDDDVITPGQEVRVSASCQDRRFGASKVVSPVVTAPDLVRPHNEGPYDVLFSMGRVAEDAKPGTYPISFTCVDREITGEFTVAAGATQAAEPVRAQVPVTLASPTETSAREKPTTKAAAAPATGGESGILAGAVGAALLAAGGAGVWAYRRRQRA